MRHRLLIGAVWLGTLAVLSGCPGHEDEQGPKRPSFIARHREHVLTGLRSRNPREVDAALECLLDGRQDADFALPDLLRLLADCDFSAQVMRYVRLSLLFESMADRSVPALFSMVRTESGDARDRALRMLSSMEPTSDLAENALVDLVTDPDVGLCWVEGVLLGRRGLPRLREKLRSADARVQLRALEAMRWFQPPAAEDTDLIVGLLESEDSAVRGAAVEALGGMGRSGAAALATVVADGEDPDLRMQAVFRLSLMGDSAREALPALWLAVASGPPELSWSADLAISSIED